MSKIKVTTITNVHIGSGNMLNLNNDFCIGKDSEGYRVIGVIDPRKVMNLIGVEHIDTWVLGIEKNRPIADIVHQYAPNATIEDYTLRTIELFTDKPTITLKECIYDGLGRPYIPGSSIKGAIRTAVLASITGDFQSGNLEILNKGGLPDASIMEKKLFGNDPTTDVFRFLHVGDAILGKFNTWAVTMVNINQNEHHNFYDESKYQTIEVIGDNDETSLEIRLKLDNYKNCIEKVGQLPQCMSSLPLLFDTINRHTLSLIESEIKYWKNLQDEDDSLKVDAYIEECKKVKAVAEKCEQGKSCLLRVGHGCGWRFITGAWSENSPLFRNKVIPSSRPNNEKKYFGYDFPKSRRVCKGFPEESICDCSLLGFVKLAIQEL